ncbi:hypothetical protein [Burkholderia sp. TSV86]|uniref:hypothetical protein n=1 Tax=Burkholderia sp. TSV86 TaxID=1385594 RepID=UPI0009EC5736|nr:hypothetical protein [Burkholderia sp. TSV86]
MVKLRARWLVLIAAMLLGLAAAGWRYGLQMKPPPASAPAAELPASLPEPMPAIPPPAPAPRSNPPLVKALPHIKVKPGGSSWNPDPAIAPAPVEAQRGAPDVPGAQPLRPPPASTP